MKRLAAATLVFLSTSAFAADTQRYLVATAHPFRAGGGMAMGREARQEGFGASFDGFAADLTSAEVAALRKNANVRWVEPVVERHALAQPARNPQIQMVPYGVDLIHAREVWAATHNNTTNVVVVDSGVDYRHPELQRVWAGGYNFVAKNDNPLDDAGHGTHVAGSIAAANNDSGVVGVAPDIRLWGLKVLNSAGSGNVENTIRAIDWIIAKKNELGGNWVVNLSLGSPDASNSEREAFKRGVDAGLLIVAATGNSSEFGLPAPVMYPAAYDNVVAVGAVSDALELASFSNQGPQIDFVGPGVDVLSTMPLGSGSRTSVTAGSILYGAFPLEGSKRGTLSGEYVFCGLGKPEEIPARVSGKIALIKRGELRFVEKTRNAMNAGAVAVIIFNNDSSSSAGFTLWPEDDPTTRTVDWPVAVAVSKEDGETLVARSANTVSIANTIDDYGYLSGTSMASPHVAAAAALVWSTSPSSKAADVKSSLAATARDLGTSGFDNVFGFGLVNVYEAVKRLAPSAFPTATTPTTPTTGRRILRRG
ncbi:MAG TPA: S8 family serine peptidase [Thermoanaerobaculia bacterium]|nr:S8 family serine peptidase [Thermoanaerobaculia bacterium]